MIGEKGQGTPGDVFPQCFGLGLNIETLFLFTDWNSFPHFHSHI